MGQADLPVIYPVAVDHVVVADQNPAPILNQRLESLPGAVGMHYKEGRQTVGHRPQPLYHPGLLPAGFINMIDRRAAHRSPDGLMHGRKCFRDPVDYLLQPSGGDGNTEDVLDELGHRLPTGALDAAHLGYQGTEPRAIAGMILLGKLRLQPAAAPGALALLQNHVFDVHLDLGQLDPLVRIKRSQRSRPPTRTAASARARIKAHDFGWREHLLPMTLMAFLASAATLGFSPLLRRPLIVRVRRRGLAGVLRVLVHSALQLLDALGHFRHGFFQLQNALLKRLHVPAHGLRGGQPVRLAEGSFDRHVGWLIMVKMKSLDFFTIISAGYTMFKFYVISMGWIDYSAP